jgi:hypothetical protein
MKNFSQLILIYFLCVLFMPIAVIALPIICMYGVISGKPNHQNAQK